MMTANRVQRLLESLQNTAWDPFFAWPTLSSQSGPQPRIWSDNDGVALELDLPGRQLDDIEVTAEKNLLYVGLKRGIYGDATGQRFVIRERSDSLDVAEFRLPFPVQPELTDVCYQNGVLRITVRKPEEEQPRRLTVKQG